MKKKVEVYEYEAELEPSYRASMLKMFIKTLDEGYFPLVIVDAINSKVRTAVLFSLHVVHLLISLSLTHSLRCPSLISFVPMLVCEGLKCLWQRSREKWTSVQRGTLTSGAELPLRRSATIQCT